MTVADGVCVSVSDPEGVDLSRFELSHISSLVKKFLAHLPNPVIPIQAYDEMLAIAEGRCIRSLDRSAGVSAVCAKQHDVTIYIAQS